ncbi:hypothetical protein ACFVVL_20765 [Kitasatospora sp. NPDC058115]|uniref:hypothetical protein n=1 Tax=Kitasatospora sp. NPDC058115 TaxID=3346347 RepID=UPI0036DE9DD3
MTSSQCSDVPAGAPAGIFRNRLERPVPFPPGLGLGLGAVVPAPGAKRAAD